MGHYEQFRTSPPQMAMPTRVRIVAAPTGRQNTGGSCRGIKEYFMPEASENSGAAEGRDPNSVFDTSFYFEQNPDAAAGVSPLEHFLQFSITEGRKPAADVETVVGTAPTAARSRCSATMRWPRSPFASTT